MTKSQLKAILFDIDDTLYSTTDFTQTANREAINAMVELGIDMTPEALLEELKIVIANTPTNYGNHFDDLLKRLDPKVVKYKPTLLVANAIVAYHKAKHRYLTIYEDAFNVIRELAKTDLCLGIITSGRSIKQAEKIVRLGIAPFLNPDAIFITEEMGSKKEEPALYQRACKEIGHKPEHCMIIGDNPKRDVDPPNEIGMITVWNQRSGKYLNEIGKTQANHTIHNFWDLQEILDEYYEF